MRFTIRDISPQTCTQSNKKSILYVDSFHHRNEKNSKNNHDMGAPTRLAAAQTPLLVLISFPSHVATPFSPVLKFFATVSQTFFFLT